MLRRSRRVQILLNAGNKDTCRHSLLFPLNLYEVCAGSDGIRFSTKLGGDTLFAQRRWLRCKARGPWLYPRRRWPPLVTFPVQSSKTHRRLCHPRQRAKAMPTKWWSCQALRITTFSDEGCDGNRSDHLLASAGFRVYTVLGEGGGLLIPAPVCNSWPTEDTTNIDCSGNLVPSLLLFAPSDTLGREFDPGKRDFSH